MELSPQDCLVLLVTAGAEPHLTDIFGWASACTHAFVGGVFPGVIIGDQTYEDGVYLLKLPAESEPVLIQPEQTGALDQLDKLRGVASGLLLVDGLSSQVETMLSAIYNDWGGQMQVFGGGCGSLDLVQRPCLFSREGIFQDAALLLPMSNPSGVGVCHGWSMEGYPLVATRTDGNTVVELNWRPAYEVYMDVISERNGGVKPEKAFFHIAKEYPFGIFREGSEVIVRDPIAHGDKGELICVGDVPENTILYVLEGSEQQLIDAANLAAKNSQRPSLGALQEVFVFDCISRYLFLEDSFQQELMALAKAFDNHESKPAPVGVLSIGEVTSVDGNGLSFFNKTTVVGSIYA